MSHTETIPQEGTILYVDIGNSGFKAAFKRGIQWEQPVHGRTGMAELLSWVNRYAGRFSLIAVSSVVEEATQLFVEGLKTDRYRILSVKDIPAGLISYSSAETLGTDRYFGCYGAISGTSKAVVVIDMGTACTVDYMSADGVFRGGVIMPGMTALEQSLAVCAPALPRVERKLPKNWPGMSTEECLQWGLTGFFRDGLHAMLERYKTTFTDFELLVTGGGAQWTASILEYPAKVRPLLVFEGMECFLKDYL